MSDDDFDTPVQEGRIQEDDYNADGDGNRKRHSGDDKKEDDGEGKRRRVREDDTHLGGGRSLKPRWLEDATTDDEPPNSDDEDDDDDDFAVGGGFSTDDTSCGGDDRESRNSDDDDDDDDDDKKSFFSAEDSTTDGERTRLVEFNRRESRSARHGTGRDRRRRPDQDQDLDFQIGVGRTHLGGSKKQQDDDHDDDGEDVGKWNSRKQKRLVNDSDDDNEELFGELLELLSRLQKHREEQVGKRNSRKQKRLDDNDNNNDDDDNKELVWEMIGRLQKRREEEVGKRDSRKQKRLDDNRGHRTKSIPYYNEDTPRVPELPEISRTVGPKKKKEKTNNARISRSVGQEKKKKTKGTDAGIARNVGQKKKAAKMSDKSETGQDDDVKEFGVQKLKRKDTILEGTEANVWDVQVEQAESMKIIDYETSRQLGDFPHPRKYMKKSKGKICGKVSQAFLAPPSDIYPGYLMGTLVLPPRATKHPESVGGCAQTFTVVSCQPKALEVLFADPDKLDGEFHQKTAQRFLLSSGDLFRVPPGNSYQIVNHSESVNAKLTWTIIRPNEDVGMDEDSE